MRTTITLGVASAALLGASLLAAPASGASAVRDTGDIKADFNGDGVMDVAIGVPLEDFAARDDGGVNVIYGSAGGLTSVGDQFWSQNTAGVQGVAEAGDHFGHALAAADFDADGFTDLAIGVPQEDFAATDDGVVQVLYGSANGLTAAGDDLWSQNSAGIAGVSEAGDQFGYSLAANNLGGTGHADLAVGVPLENFAASDDGGVNVIYGSAGGLSSAGDQFWSQNSANIDGIAENGDQFGYSLAAANLGNSAQADLAIGVPLEDLTGTNDGAVNVIYGAAAGLASAGDQFWNQDSAGIFGAAESGDRFGLSLAAANLGKTLEADLAVGVPYEDFGATDDGGVNVIYGAAAGLAAGDQFWSQDSAGIFGTAESNDRYGYSLAAADMGKTSAADLAIGVPFEDFSAVNDGGVSVVYGTATGLAAAGDQFWSQDSAGIFGSAEASDLYGYSLAVGNLGNGSQADLVIGVPFEDFGATNDGGVGVVYGSAGGLGAAGDQFWSQDSAGTSGVAENSDNLGLSVSVRH